MTFLIFPTKSAAITADRQVAINNGMGSEADDTTRRYQSTHEQVDGTWYFPTPPDVAIDGLPTDSLAGVTGYTRADTVDPMPPPESIEVTQQQKEQ